MFARAVATKAGIFKIMAANREIDRAAVVAHRVYDYLNETVKKAAVNNVVFDGTHQGFTKALMSALNME